MSECVIYFCKIVVPGDKRYPQTDKPYNDCKKWQKRNFFEFE